MFNVKVYSGDVEIDEKDFYSEDDAMSFASECQDEGFKVRLFSVAEMIED